MTYEHLYSLINLAVMPAWLLMIFLPRSGITKTVAHSGLYPIILGIFNSAAGVSLIFSHPLGIMVGWSHYLVFDLFVGAWEARDAQRRGMSHFALVPCLIFTLMLGPVGLLLYLTLRAITGKGGFSLIET
jgi:hypothetical protein